MVTTERNVLTEALLQRTEERSAITSRVLPINPIDPKRSKSNTFLFVSAIPCYLRDGPPRAYNASVKCGPLPSPNRHIFVPMQVLVMGCPRDSQTRSDEV